VTDSPAPVQPLTFTIIFCAWQAMDYLPESLTPWVEARRNAKVGEHQFRIVAVSVPFIGFDHSDTKPDGTRQYLQAALDRGDIDHIVNGDLPRTEVVARGAALKWARERGGCTHTFMVDSDEVYTAADIQAIAGFVALNPFTVWFRLSLRNAVFDRHTFLVEPFTPPRIHRIDSLLSLVASHFWDDNNIAYVGSDTQRVIRDVELTSMTIPPTVAAPKHYSWLSDERSKCKVAYQITRWGHCSFRWNDATNTLEFDPAYYAAQGLPLPEVIHD
jgi:hypothetical protein